MTEGGEANLDHIFKVSGSLIIKAAVILPRAPLLPRCYIADQQLRDALQHDTLAEEAF